MSGVTHTSGQQWQGPIVTQKWARESKGGERILSQARAHRAHTDPHLPKQPRPQLLHLEGPEAWEASIFPTRRECDLVAPSLGPYIWSFVSSTCS